MKVALIGSTGLAGKYIIDFLLQNNIDIKALVRKNISTTNSKVEYILGSAFDENVLEMLIEKTDVVINTIGQLKNVDDFYAPTTERITHIMKKYKVKRYIGITGASVRLKEDKKTFLGGIGTFIMNRLYPKMMNDKMKEIDIIKNSETNWTIVRLPLVKEGSLNKAVNTSLNKVSGTKIYNKQIAEFIVNQIDSNEYSKKFPIISQ